MLARKQLQQAEWASSFRTNDERELLLHLKSSDIPLQIRLKQLCRNSITKGSVLPEINCYIVLDSESFRDDTTGTKTVWIPDSVVQPS